MLQDDPEKRKRALISQEAAEWFARMQDPGVSLDERRRFLRWLKQSPVHVAEYLTIAGIGSDLQRVQLGTMLGAAATSNVVELIEQDDEPPEAAREAPVSRWNAAATITVCGFAALLFVAVRFPWHEHSIDTGPGEWQTMTLADGSELQLGPNTLLRVDLGDARRAIALERGEAYFKVTKDPARPFVVQANAYSVRAVGTEFAVAHHKQELIVTVAEGSVRVAPSSRFETQPAASAPPFVPIAADQQVRIAGTWPVTPRDVDVRYELAWRERQLMFRPGDTLGKAAEQFNSRNRVQLRVDPAAAALPVRGNFSASDPLAFVQSLAGTAPIAMERPSKEVLLVKRR